MGRIIVDDDSDPVPAGYDEGDSFGTRAEAIEAGIAVARQDASAEEEPCQVVVCLNEEDGPCPRRAPDGGCDLCERITVHPDGRVEWPPLPV